MTGHMKYHFFVFSALHRGLPDTCHGRFWKKVGLFGAKIYFFEAPFKSWGTSWRDTKRAIKFAKETQINKDELDLHLFLFLWNTYKLIEPHVIIHRFATYIWNMKIYNGKERIINDTIDFLHIYRTKNRNNGSAFYVWWNEHNYYLPVDEFRGMSVLWKKSIFSIFFVSAPRKISNNFESDNIEVWRLAHSSFRNLCSTFFKTPVEVSDIFKIVGPSRLWSQVIQDRVLKKPSF